MDWNPTLVRALVGARLTLNGRDLLTPWRHVSETYAISRWETWTTSDELGVRIVAQVASGSSTLDVWTMFHFGVVGEPSPRITFSDGIRIELWTARALEAASVPAPTISVLADVAPGWAGHGQRHLAHFGIDFASGTTWSHSLPEFASTGLAVPFPRQTGGVWPYFGIHHDAGKHTLHWLREELYPLAAQPGCYVYRDGEPYMVAEGDGLVLGESWWHERSRSIGKNWIQHTDPQNPWRDRHQADQHGQPWMLHDSEHYELWDWLCQATVAHPEDAGFGILVVHAAHQYLAQLPAIPQGTTHHEPGTPRARGRVLSAGAHLVLALRAIRETWLADKVRTRALHRLRNQMDLWATAEQYGENMPLQAKPGEVPGYKLQEFGIWFVGLWSCSLSHMRGMQDGDELHVMMLRVAEFVLDGFHDYDGRWDIPYVLVPNAPLQRPGGAAHFCIAALQWLARYKLADVERAKKVLSILDQWLPDMETRWLLP